MAQELPAWSLPAAAVDGIELADDWPAAMTRDWAWGGSTGKGVRVCLLDSGIEPNHHLIGPVQRSVAVTMGDDAEISIADDDADGDLCGHGTACAGIIRGIAPECDLVSVRVLGSGFKGSGQILVAGLRWAVEQGYEVVNMSLSTTKREIAEALHEISDNAYFKKTMIVAAAHNLPVDSYPWRFAAVVSVGSHDREDPLAFYYNPTPPVEFFARGVDIDVAWLGGTTIRSTGNSFATPHMAGLCALVLGKHPGLTPFQLKSVLYLTATNVGEGA
ncbi:MAG TPA: S8 family serine peptidase [Gaiellaceae bacterium]|nr:S8 family serine peptidase [Gaiellaceae bacterium]